MTGLQSIENVVNKNIRDLTGKKFNRLLVVSDSGVRSNSGCVLWKCLCDCGNYHNARGYDLKAGNIKSCGCFHSETAHTQQRKNCFKHGKTKSVTYNAWSSLRQRCLEPTNRAYADYGGRGIDVCQSWIDSFQTFYADMGDPPKGYSLDRIDNSKGYNPDNCRWASKKEQANNRRSCVPLTLNGTTLNMKQWAELLGMDHRTIHKRIKDGWSVEHALTVPILKNGPRTLNRYLK